jgi:hypothetical protein
LMVLYNFVMDRLQTLQLSIRFFIDIKKAPVKGKLRFLPLNLQDYL